MADGIVEKIKDALDIVEIIGESVRLTKKGRNFSGLCPFHNEKTPSFMVSSERQSWHCFGCGKGGDVFSFVMQKEGMSFPEALEYLAHRAGIDLPRGTHSSVAPDLYSVMEEALAFFRASLKKQSGAIGRGYLARRNITMQDADRFELGWAPGSWRSLIEAMREKGITQSQLLSCGLVVQGDRGNYDRFRGRVTFPIRNVSGRLIAFGGRIVDGDGAKYLNSPEGPLYNKKRNLYLLDKAKRSIHEKGSSILVEGYMDAIRLHMHGHQETVASLGTSLTEEQAALLKRFSDKCYICYDADAAGQAAILRGMYILQRAGLDVRVVQFPGGKDPDEMLQNDGGDAQFNQALEDAKPLVLHHIGVYREQAKTIGAAKAGEKLLNGLAQLTPVELAPYMGEIARSLGLYDYQLASELNRLRSGQHPPVRRENPAPVSDVQPEEDSSARPYSRAEAALVYMLWTDEKLRSEAPLTDTVKIISDERLKDIAGALLSGEKPAELEARWLELDAKFPLAVIANGGAFCETLSGNLNSKWDSLTQTLSRRAKKKRYEALKALMLRAQATPDEISEYMTIAAELKKY